LTIDGDLTIEESSGRQTTVDFSLDAKYEFNGGTIALKAVYGDDEYNLEVEGDIELKGLGRFELRASAATGIGQALSIDFEGNDDSIFRSVGIQLERTPDGKIRWIFGFKLQFTWVNGRLTVQNPRVLNALNNPG
jgi:hypothetical protein